MKKLSLIVSLILVSFISIYLTSCATIVTGTHQLVTINCNVDSADVKLDGVLVGKTPFTGEIKKNGNVITVEAEGYKTHEIALSTTTEGMFWGNIITGGTLGSITDYASGAAYKYAPSSFQVELIKKGVALNIFKKNYELKKFAMVNMSNITIDISNNGGQYLNSLIQLANKEPNENTYELVRSLLIKSKGDQVAFGKEITQLL